jgi:transposase
MLVMNTTLHTKNYNAYQPNMLLDFSLSFEKDIAHDDICRTVIEVAEGINVAKYVDFSNRNSYGYDGVMMFKILILAKSLFGYCSTRRLADLCKTDIRFMFIAENQRPSHMAFERFISNDLTMPVEDLFYEVNKYIDSMITVNTDVLCIDGTKYEANANKNTFIWRKNTLRNRMKRWKKSICNINKINKFLERENVSLRYSLLKEPSIDYLLNISDRLEEYMKDNHIEFVHGKGKRKSEIQKLYDELKENAMKLWEYSIHLDMLGNRNSCSKTDVDATFMHMKYDYYNHTNVFKPGYNIQTGVSEGFIRNIYISSDSNDLKTYIPFMEKYKQAYGVLPTKTPADAGYGSYDNYKYCKENNIELYMKYSGYYKEKEKTTEKNKFQTRHLKKDENNNYICPAGHMFELEKETIDKRSLYPKVNKKLVNHHCQGCPMKSKCTRSAKGRTITCCEELEAFHEEVKRNVQSKEGIKLMYQRSNEAEGTFGDLKQNQGYNRLRRRGESGVKLEIYMIAIGQNIRKYHRRKIENRKKAEKLLSVLN